jgi:ketosteroid isomerase-like protein
MNKPASILASCWVLIFVAGSSIASFGQNKTVDAIRSADQAWMKVFAAKDLEKSVAFMDDKGAVLCSNAPIADSKDAITKMFIGFFTIPDLKISWHPDRADVARSGDLAAPMT